MEVDDMRRFLPFLALAALASCALGNMPTPRATYRPLSDASLYSRIAQIPGVTRVDVNWTNGFDSPNGYGGVIEIHNRADPMAILDRVLAILRQGRPDADLGGIQVAPPDAGDVSADLVGLASQADYAARYGPQPGTGIPPPTPLHRVR